MRNRYHLFPAHTTVPMRLSESRGYAYYPAYNAGGTFLLNDLDLNLMN
jgi:hypothetical protein